MEGYQAGVVKADRCEKGKKENIGIDKYGDMHRNAHVGRQKSGQAGRQTGRHISRQGGDEGGA